MTNRKPPARTSDDHSLRYRVATYHSLIAHMTTEAMKPFIRRTDPPAENPLQRLPAGAGNGWVQALFDAWAVVGDVLTFYQERIANEGYLRTAHEPFSIRELVRTIGYEPRPPLSARTTFAFAITNAAATPPETPIPKGTPIGAPPPPDGSPAPVFETDDELIARAEWNAMVVTFPPLPARGLAESGDAARLTGEDLGLLHPGAPLLIRRTVAAQSDDRVVTIVSVEPDAAANATLVRWSPALPPDDAAGEVQLFAFRGSTGIFGAKAPDWSTLPEATRARYATRPGGLRAQVSATTWADLPGTPPDQDPLALAFADGALLALYADRLLRWDGGAWTLVLRDIARSLLSLATVPGAIYLGTSRGEVRVSRDAGATWAPVGSDRRSQGRVESGLPPVAVHALAVRAGVVPLVIAGTDRGVAVVRDDGSPWILRNHHLGGVGKDNRPAPISVTSLALRDDTLLAATSAGLWRASVRRTGLVWTRPPASEPVRDAMIEAVALGAAHAYAAGENGLFQAGPDWRWTRVVDPAIAAAPRAVAASGDAVVTSAPGGVAVSHDAGRTWSAIADEASTDAAAVAVDRGGALAYAWPLCGTHPANWPGFALHGTELDLERLIPTLARDQIVALVDQSSSAAPAIASRITALRTERVRAFQQAGLVSHVALYGPLDCDLSAFGRRTARFYYGARRLALAPAAVGAPRAVPDPAHPETVTVDVAKSLLPKERRIVVRGRPLRARVIGAAGGIRRIAAGSVSAWGLGGLDCRLLAGAADGTVYAATTAHGVWRRLPGPVPFVPWQAGSELPDIAALAVAGDGRLVAATANGIYHRAPSDARWSGPVQTAELFGLLALALGGEQTLWSGGTDGMWRSGDHGASWVRVTELGAPAGRGAEDAVRALLSDGSTLLAGTASGVAVREPDGTWRHTEEGLENRSVISLAADAARWFAGTDGGGIYWSDDRGRRWRRYPLAVRSGAHQVFALAVAGGRVFAGVRGYGVLHGPADGSHPAAPLDMGIANDVRALLPVADGVLAAARSGTVLASRAGVRAEIMLQDIGPAGAGQYAATCAELDQNTLPAGLRLEMKALGLALPPKVAVRRVREGGWSISAEGIQDLFLRTAPDASAIIVATVRSYVVSAASRPPAEGGAGTSQLWSFVLPAAENATDWLHDDRLVGTFLAGPGEVELVAAHADDPRIAEVAIVADTAAHPEQGITSLTLAQPPAHLYDGSTTELLANCVGASHGMSSTTYEVIGSGDASQANQTFTLKRPGLSWLLGPDGTPEPQINVSVQPSVARGAIASIGDLRAAPAETLGVPWSVVKTLADAGPEDRVYTVTADERGGATLEFGDGANGRRLPTGSENVVAAYRMGNGPSGNLAAESITILRRRAGGLSGATNPIAADGGVAAQEPGSTREAARRGLISLGRIVSVWDLEDFARARAGIAKSKLRLGPERRPVAHLTVAGHGDTTLDDGALAELRAAIRDAGGAAIPLRVHTHRRTWIRIEATLGLEPHVAADAIASAAIAAEAARRLRGALAFERRALGEDLVAARTIELLQAAPGVETVELTAFCNLTSSPDVVAVVPGHDESSLTQGEIVVLLSPADLRLETKPR